MFWKKRNQQEKISKRRIYVLAVTLPLLLILVPAIYFGLRYASKTEAVWMDDSWAYRVKIPVTDHTGDETNKYFIVTIDTSDTTRFQADCGDMRFTDVSGKILQYYIASGCSSASTVTHVLVPSFPTGATDYYLYYGNPNAPNGFAAADFSAATGVTVGSVGSEEKGNGPLLNWGFGEGYGTTTNDTSENRNTGTLGGATPPSWQTEDQCISGKCLYFQGTVAKVTGSAVVKNVQTISFWIKPNTIATQGLVNLDGGTHKIVTDGSGVIGATGFTSPSYYLNGNAVTSLTLVQNQWNFVTITTGTGFDSTSSFTIGTDGTNFIKANIDSFKIYNYARSSSQVKADYASLGASKGVSSTQGGGSQKSLSDGLVGYWKMDETATPALDSSGNGQSGTWTASPTSAIGKFGNAVSFASASSQYITITDTAPLSPSSQITVSAWINPTTNVTSRSIVVKDTAYRMTTNASSQLVCEIYSGGAWQTAATGATTLTAGSWQHVTCTYDGTTLRGFVNGALDGTSTIAVAINDSAAAVEIGRNVSTNYFNGVIDEAHIYNRALSALEVRQLYTFAPGPVGYWKLDENTGSTINDSSGNGNTGTLVGGPIWDHGKYGSGVTFDGSTQFASITITDPSSSNTVETWVYPTTSIASKNIITTSKLATNGSSQPTYGSCTGTAISLNTWTYIVAVSDGSSICKIYQNGVLTASNTTGVSFGTTFNIGVSSFSGKLDEVKLYNYARSPSQVIEDMNGGHPATGGNAPVVYLSLDDGGGAIAHNTGSAGSAYNATWCGSWNNGATCKVGGCANTCTNANQYITNGNAIDLNVGLAAGFTWASWINPTNAGGSNTGKVFSKGNSYLRLGNPSGSNLDLVANLDLASVDASVTASTAITINTWSYVALSYNSSTSQVTIWVNGRPVATSTNGSGAPAADTANFKLDTGDSTFYQGYYDEFKIYNFEQSQDQIIMDMNAGSSLNFAGSSTEGAQVVDGAGTTPIGYWPLDEKTGTTAYDHGGDNAAWDSGTDGTLNNSPTWSISSQCKIGGCLSFASASSQDVTVSSTIAGIKSVSFWAKPTSTTTSLLQLQASGAVAITASSGTISATGFTSPTIYVNGQVSSTLAANVWQYITVTSATGVSASQIKFGHVNATYYDGLLDDIKLYDYARTKAQVNYDYNRGAPIGWWQFDECQGATAYDASGNGNNATLTYGGGTYTQVGTCNSGTASDAWYGGATGKFNGGIAIDTTTDTISIGDIALYNFERTDPFSTSIWFKTSTLQSTTLFSKQESSGNFRGWNIQTDSAGKFYFQLVNVYSSNILEARSTNNVTYNDSAWHHLVTTYDGSTNFSGVHIYYDGKEIALTQDFIGNTLNATTQTTTPVYIGSRNGSAQKWSGFLDDARLYNYALSATQVKKLMLGGSSINFGPSTGSP